jgi:hypothetical protein
MLNVVMLSVVAPHKMLNPLLLNLYCIQFLISSVSVSTHFAFECVREKKLLYKNNISRRHNTEHSDAEHNDTQHNVVQHNDT